MPGSERQNNMFEASPVKQYVQKGNPMPVTSCGRRRAGGIGEGFNSPIKMADDSPLEKIEDKLYDR